MCHFFVLEHASFRIRRNIKKVQEYIRPSGLTQKRKAQQIKTKPRPKKGRAVQRQKLLCPRPSGQRHHGCWHRTVWRYSEIQEHVSLYLERSYFRLLEDDRGP